MKTTKKPAKTLSLVRISLVKEKEFPYKSSIRNPGHAASILQPFFKDLDREALYVLSLSASKKPLSINLVSLGSVTSSLAHPREIFKPAILSNAVSIVLAHNHPSGDSSPSPADIDITKKIKKAGMLLKINLNDHIIFYGDEENEFTSLLETGFFDE